jgi:hypothetical protein
MNTFIIFLSIPHEVHHWSVVFLLATPFPAGNAEQTNRKSPEWSRLAFLTVNTDEESRPVGGTFGREIICVVRRLAGH